MSETKIPPYVCPIQKLIDDLGKFECGIKKITDDWNSIGDKKEEEN